MPVPLIALFAVVIAAVSLWGWGWAVRRAGRLEANIPLTAAIGLAAVIAVGGGLNLCRLAYPRILDAVVILGLGLAAAGVRDAIRRGAFKLSGAAALAWVPVAIVGVFVAWYLLPWAAYNTADDLEKYFAHPVRMLQTGTLAPNFLGTLGGETLGGQALLHAFAINHVPIAYLGAVDYGFCLLLCLALAGAAAPAGRWGTGGLAAAICLLVFPPQIVNASAVFSGAALMMAAILLTRDAAENRLRAAAVLGVVYAALLALKSTFAVFVVWHLIAWPLSAALARRNCWKAGLVSAASTLIFVSPWLVLHVPLYLARSSLTVPEFPPFTGSSVRELFLSGEANNYGIAQGHVTVIVVSGVALAIAALASLRNTSTAEDRSVRVAVAAAGCAVFAGFVGLAIATDRYLVHVSGATRYAAPMLMALLPAQLGLLAADSRGRKAMELVRPLVAAGMVGLFWPSLVTRIHQIRTLHTPLVFLATAKPSVQTSIIGYNRRVLGGLQDSTIEHIQSLVPAGQPLAVWIMTPFLLDFARNRIHHADPAGLTMPWTQIPADTHYFVLEYGSAASRPRAEFEMLAQEARPGERRLGVSVLGFLEQVEQRSRRGRILYNDGVYVLIRTEPGA